MMTTTTLEDSLVKSINSAALNVKLDKSYVRVTPATMDKKLGELTREVVRKTTNEILRAMTSPKSARAIQKELVQIIKGAYRSKGYNTLADAMYVNTKVGKRGGGGVKGQNPSLEIAVGAHNQKYKTMFDEYGGTSEIDTPRYELDWTFSNRESAVRRYKGPQNKTAAGMPQVSGNKPLNLTSDNRTNIKKYFRDTYSVIAFIEHGTQPHYTRRGNLTVMDRGKADQFASIWKYDLHRPVYVPSQLPVMLPALEKYFRTPIEASEVFDTNIRGA